MKAAAVLSLFSVLCLGSLAQRDVRLTVPFHIDAGANWATLERDSARNFTQKLGSAISLSGGVGLRYKERLAFNTSVGLVLDNYTFVRGREDYMLTRLTTELRSGLLVQVPRPSFDGSFYLGGDVGLKLFGEDVLEETLGGFSSRAEAYGPHSWFIAPEVGLSMPFDRAQMFLGLTYAYHFRDTHSMKVFLTDEQGTATATAKGDYLGLKVRYQLDVAGHIPWSDHLPKPTAQNNLANWNGREVREATSFSVPNRHLVLKIWDNAEVDGDTISVYLNGRPVLVGHALTKEKHKLRIPLEFGENTILVVAHNEGRIPPNTLTCEARSGLFRKSFLVRSDLEHHAAIRVTL